MNKDQKIIKLRKKGFTYAEIAKKVGVTKNIVCGCIARNMNPNRTTAEEICARVFKRNIK